MAGQKLDVYIASSITWAAAATALILRVVARRMTKQQWWFDDYFCLASFCFASAYNSILIYWATHYFLGQVIDPSLTPEQRENVNVKSRLLMLCCEYNYAFSIACTKLTILILYWRLFRSPAIRLAIKIMLGISIAWILLRTFMVSFQCLPTKYFWDKSIKGHCAINESQFFFGTILTHCIMDCIILVLPVIEVGKLRLKLGQKLAVIGLFLIGFLVCIASVITIIYSIQYPNHTDEMPRDTAPSFIWGNVEMNIAILSACVPLLRPVFRHILPKSFLSSYGSSHPISRTNLSRTNHSHAIKLSTITRSNEHDAFDASSTHKIVDPEEGMSSHSNLDQRPDAFQTIITSNNLSSSRSYSSDEDAAAAGGIYMRNDISVHVEEKQHAYEMRR